MRSAVAVVAPLGSEALKSKVSAPRLPNSRSLLVLFSSIIGVVALATVQDVITRPPDKGVVLEIAVNDVVTVASVKDVIPVAAKHGIGARIPGQGIVPEVAVNRIVAFASIDFIIPLAPIDRIITSSTEDDVIAKITVDEIVAFGVEVADKVITLSTIESIITTR